MTSGGYRTVSPRATVARFRRHVSPLTGVVSLLERIDADLPMNTNYHAAHNFSAPARTVDELRAGLSGGSFGKGSTAEQGEASALMEAIERYSGIFQGDEIRVTRRFTDFPQAKPLLRTTSCCSATRSIAKRRPPTVSNHARCRRRSIDRPRSNGRRCGRCATGGLNICRPASCISSTGGSGQINADSNGCAAGNTLEEAIVQGFLELVERDAYAIWWYNRLRRAASGPRPVRRFLHPRSANPACRNRTPALGARRHQRSRDSELRGDGALDEKRQGKYRVRFRRAFRCAHCPAARAHRAQSIPVDRPDGRRERRANRASTAPLHCA